MTTTSGGGKTVPKGAELARADLLSALLKSPPVNPTHILTPLASLREIVAVCESIAGGRSAPGAGDLRSLRADTEAALTALGDELRRELEPGWKDFFHGELNELANLLRSSAGSARLGASGGTLIARLRTSSAAKAAWRDLVRVADGASITTDEAMHLAVVFREIDESLGHEWLWRVPRIRDLLYGGEFKAVEELVGSPASDSALVAWFVFADADLPEAYLRVGQTQFFSARLWPDAVLEPTFLEGVPGSEFPAELDPETIEQWFTVNDGSAALVYARVELGGPRARTTAAARERGRAPCGVGAGGRLRGRRGRDLPARRLGVASTRR